MTQPGQGAIGNRVSRLQTMQGVLGALCHEHGLEAAVLVGEEGLPLAAAPATYDAEVLAAVTAQLQRTARQAQKQLGLPDVDEIGMAVAGGSRLVGRCFLAGGQALILTVVVPGRAPYRRATNQAMRAIRRAWGDR